ncbi:hypothetical protein V6N13_125381 [Hibiscus sabdariffa]|uniref:Uncharacterized protein n=1 Tax=Hibiscus sabdariffa TaxID=183260 RepID=A0ABR2U687_9ROSI
MFNEFHNTKHYSMIIDGYCKSGNQLRISIIQGRSCKSLSGVSEECRKLQQVRNREERRDVCYLSRWLQNGVEPDEIISGLVAEAYLKENNFI